MKIFLVLVNAFSFEIPEIDLVEEEMQFLQI